MSCARWPAPRPRPAERRRPVERDHTAELTLIHPLFRVVDMDISAAIDELTRGEPLVDVAACRARIAAAGRVISWATGLRAAAVSVLEGLVSFPEPVIAEAGQSSLRAAGRELEQAATLSAVPALAAALVAGTITAGQAAEVHGQRRGVPAGDRAAFDAELEGVIAVAADADRFSDELRRVRREVDASRTPDRLARQRARRRLRHWTDADGMWRLSATFDPVSGLGLQNFIRDATNALRAEALPEGCPDDPVERHQFLQAVAFHRAVMGGVGVRSGRPELIIVVDETVSPPIVDTGSDLDIPVDYVEGIRATAAQFTIRYTAAGIECDTGGPLDLGRSSRLPNRAQRRALRGLYSTCAIPGCRVGFDLLKIHHVHYWRDGGCTDFHNLLPVCDHDHQRIHRDGWLLTLDSNRNLNITLPDGTVMTTGPPQRTAA